MLALSMTWYASNGGGMEATDSSTVLTAVSVLLAVASLRAENVAGEELGLFDVIVAVMDAAAVGFDLGQWGSGY